MESFPRLYERTSREGEYRCLLCPHNCLLKKDQCGICRIRKATDSGVFPIHPAPVTTLAVDPIEKKPLFHFLPGQSILSIGFDSCNLRCPFCQNWQIAQSVSHEYYDLPPEELPSLCRLKDSPGVAFTYSEPLVHYEYLIQSAELLREEELVSVMVSNGYIQPTPGKFLAERLDAVKVDLKGYNEEWYARELKGSLKPVLDFIAICAERTHLEVVSLIIPGKNDSKDEIRKSARFLSSLNPEIPFHLTAYYPQYHYTIHPTDRDTILNLADTARDYLKYVYTGNTGAPNRTICSGCGAVLIDRSGYEVKSDGLTDGKCRQCGISLFGHF